MAENTLENGGFPKVTFNPNKSLGIPNTNIEETSIGDMAMNAHTRQLWDTTVSNFIASADDVTNQDEALFLACDSKERQRLFEMEIRREQNISLTLTVVVCVPEDSYKEKFILEFTLFGFSFRRGYNEDTIAYCRFGKNLAYDFDEVDIEFLRGLAALAFIHLSNRLNKKFEMHDVINSPYFTEFLYKCKVFMDNERRKSHN